MTVINLTVAGSTDCISELERPQMVAVIVRFLQQYDRGPFPGWITTAKGSTIGKAVYACRSVIKKGLGDIGWLHNDLPAVGGADTVRKKLCQNATHAIIFWDGKSAGTRKLIDMIESRNIPFEVHLV